MSLQPANSGRTVKHFVGELGKSFGGTRHGAKVTHDFRYGDPIKQFAVKNASPRYG